MTKLTKEILDLFDERFPEVGIKRGAGESWSIDFDANINIKSFLQEVVKRAYEEGRESLRLEIMHEQRKLLDGFGHPKDCPFCSELNQKEE